MKFQDGTYRVYRIHHGHGKPIERLIARFFIKAKQFHVLEDYEDLFEDSLFNGDLTSAHIRHLEDVFNSGYFKLIHEKEANEGEHSALIDDLEIGDLEPDGVFLLQREDQEPQLLELYKDRYVLDGKQLDDDEVEDIMKNVHIGLVTMEPVGNSFKKKETLSKSDKDPAPAIDIDSMEQPHAIKLEHVDNKAAEPHTLASALLSSNHEIRTEAHYHPNMSKHVALAAMQYAAKNLPPPSPFESSIHDDIFASPHFKEFLPKVFEPIRSAINPPKPDFTEIHKNFAGGPLPFQAAKHYNSHAAAIRNHIVESLGQKTPSNFEERIAVSDSHMDDAAGKFWPSTGVVQITPDQFRRQATLLAGANLERDERKKAIFANGVLMHELLHSASNSGFLYSHEHKASIPTEEATTEILTHLYNSTFLHSHPQAKVSPKEYNKNIFASPSMYSSTPDHYLTYHGATYKDYIKSFSDMVAHTNNFSQVEGRGSTDVDRDVFNDTIYHWAKEVKVSDNSLHILANEILEHYGVHGYDPRRVDKDLDTHQAENANTALGDLNKHLIDYMHNSGNPNQYSSKLTDKIHEVVRNYKLRHLTRYGINFGV